jgi:hypothetical protein
MSLQSRVEQSETDLSKLAHELDQLRGDNLLEMAPECIPRALGSRISTLVESPDDCAPEGLNRFSIAFR